MTEDRNTAGNSSLTIWRLKCFIETFVQSSTAVILLNPDSYRDTENPPLRQAAKRNSTIRSASLCYFATSQMN